MTDELFSVQGKRFFVTGGASGIGRMLTEGLAERGARVFTCGRKQESITELLTELKQKRGLDVHAEPADLSKMSEVERIVGRDGASADAGRRRWKFYRDRGYALQHHALEPGS